MTIKKKAKEKGNSKNRPMHGGNQSGCVVVPTGGEYRGNQGLNYFAGISSESANAQGICMHMVTIPPGERAEAHRHENHETAIYVLSGEVEVWCGEGLREQQVVRAGEFIYIPASTSHLPINWSSTEPCVAVLARTDPNEQESVVLMPELDKIPDLMPVQ